MWSREPESPVAKVLKEASDVAESKYALYGNTYDQTGEIMHILWPKGVDMIGPTSYTFYSVVTWIVGKLCRFATAKTYESRLDSLKDLVVYAAMAYEIYKRGDTNAN